MKLQYTHSVLEKMVEKKIIVCSYVYKMMVNSPHQLKEAPINRDPVRGVRSLVWTVHHHFLNYVTLDC